MAKNYKVSYADQGEDMVLTRVLKQCAKFRPGQKGFYLDIGAYHPVQRSVTKRLYDAGWSGICIDISRESIRLFEEHRPRDIAVCAAAGRERGEITAYYLEDDISILNTTDPAEAARLIKSGAKIREDKVPVKTVDEIMDEHAPATKIDVMNIDVQRTELDVLAGISCDRYAPTVIAVEIHTSSIDAALQTPIAGFLRYQGYVPVASCVITMFWYRKQVAPH